MIYLLVPLVMAPSSILEHKVSSPHQNGITTIRVLLPKPYKKTAPYKVAYVLPVEAKTFSHYGDGLKEIEKLKLHQKHPAIFVQPTFSQLPWYANHPSDKKIQQETYLLHTVLPFIEKQYKVQKNANGRLLLGFSKSGWGAFSLLLRHPRVFGRAAAWDAPLMMNRHNGYGSGPIFGNRKNFLNYHVPTLLEQQAKMLKGKRLALLGYSNFKSHHEQLHQKMKQWHIPHLYLDVKKTRHRWDAGWVANGIDFLLQD